MVIETRHLVERDAVEQDLHVLDGVDGHAGFADITHHTWVIAVVAPMGREIEGDGEPHLPAARLRSIERVRFFCGGEAGVLANRPRTIRVHRRSRASQKGRNAWDAIRDAQARRGRPRCTTA